MTRIVRASAARSCPEVCCPALAKTMFSAWRASSGLRIRVASAMIRALR